MSALARFRSWLDLAFGSAEPAPAPAAEVAEEVVAPAPARQEATMADALAHFTLHHLPLANRYRLWFNYHGPLRERVFPFVMFWEDDSPRWLSASVRLCWSEGDFPYHCAHLSHTPYEFRSAADAWRCAQLFCESTLGIGVISSGPPQPTIITEGETHEG